MSSPWPKVQVGGRLESADKEWLHTNGAGAYSMSTVARRHTRRYHGLLVAALSPPVDRWVILSDLDEVVVALGRTYRLSAQQSPDAAPTPGYRFLESYEQDPLPRFSYRLGRSRLEIVVALVRGQNALVMAYTWHGREPAALKLRPLLALRRMHGLMSEHGAMMQRVRLRPGVVDIRPDKALPRIVFGHQGLFLGSPDWYRKLEYPEDKLRRTRWEEDLWTPGGFELTLLPRRTTSLVVAVDRLPEGQPQDLVADTKRFLEREDPGDERPLAVRELTLAAEQFSCDATSTPVIIAGYPWLGALSRDALIALPGLYLVRGRAEGAKRVLSAILAAMRDDLVPRRVRDPAGVEGPLSSEATLWLFEAARQLVESVGRDDEFVREQLFPALCRTFRCIRDGDRALLRVAPSGLVESTDDEVTLPWMDARTGVEVSASRSGHAVELQALWSRGTDTLAGLAEHYGDAGTAREARAACAAVRSAFAARFWCEATRYPFDCLRTSEGREDPVLDASIRANALVALDVDPELFERWQAVAILERVRERLLTTRGIRSLDPDHPAYRGEYGGSVEERRAAHFQGLAWTHLLGAYARASRRLAPNDFDLEENLRLRIEEARAGGPVLGQVPQFSDGEPPFRPGGCPAQAVSVAELLRTLVWDLGL